MRITWPRLAWRSARLTATPISLKGMACASMSARSSPTILFNLLTTQQNNVSWSVPFHKAHLETMLLSAAWWPAHWGHMPRWLPSDIVSRSVQLTHGDKISNELVWPLLYCVPLSMALSTTHRTSAPCASRSVQGLPIPLLVPGGKTQRGSASRAVCSLMAPNQASCGISLGCASTSAPRRWEWRGPTQTKACATTSAWRQTITETLRTREVANPDARSRQWNNTRRILPGAAWLNVPPTQCNTMQTITWKNVSVPARFLTASWKPLGSAFKPAPMGHSSTLTPTNACLLAPPRHLSAIDSMAIHPLAKASALTAPTVLTTHTPMTN